MMSVMTFAVILASATVGEAQAVPMLTPALQGAPLVRDSARSHVAQSLITPSFDPEKPPKEWLTKMVRPCARSGNRLVC